MWKGVYSPLSGTSITLLLVGWALHINGQPPGYSLHQSLMYKTWDWKNKWSCTQAVPHQLHHSTTLLPPLHPWGEGPSARGVWRKAGIRGAGALPVLPKYPKGANQKTTWNKWAWQKWWGGRDCCHLPWEAASSRGLLQEGGSFSHLCRLEGHGLFSLVLAFSPQKWISNPV